MTPERNAAPSSIPLVAGILLVATLGVVWLLSRAAPFYVSDSWAFAELARSFDEDFYRIRAWRSFHSDVPYSTSFPPLWPALIWLAGRLSGALHTTGYPLGFFFVPALAVVAEFVARRSFRAPGAGVLSTLALLFFTPFVSELASGGTLPLNVFLLAALLGLLVAWRGSVAGRLAIGLTAGLMVLGRFDAMPMALVVVLLVACAERSVAAGATALAGLVVGVAPWIAYSWLTFGTVFQSDNSLVVASVDPGAYVTDFHAAPPLSWRDDPSAWLAKVVAHVPVLVIPLALLAGLSALGALAPIVAIALGRSSLRERLRPTSSHWALLPAAALVIAYPYLIQSHLTPVLKLLIALAFPAFALLMVLALWRHRDVFSADEEAADGYRMMAGLLLALLAVLPAYLVTGYADLRYFSPLIWLLGFLLLVVLMRRLDELPSARRLQLALAVLIGAAVLIRTGWYLQSEAPKFVAWNEQQIRDGALLQACLADRSREGRSTLLLLRDDILAARLGATSELSVAYMPRNLELLTLDERRQFLDAFDIGYVFATEDRYRTLLPGKTLRRLPECAIEVYEIVPR